MNVDVYTSTGTMHGMCQDYSIGQFGSFGQGSLPYLILTDGCSSSPNTDIGARLLALSAKKILDRYFREQYIVHQKKRVATFYIGEIDWKDFGQTVIHNAQFTADTLGLDHQCLDSTLSFENNAPYYLSYWADVERRGAYLSTTYNAFIQSRVNAGVPLVDCTRAPNPYKATETCQNPDHSMEYSFSLEEWPILCVSTDGIDSFLDDQGNRLPYDFVLEQFLSFKNYNGEFVKRRAKRAIQTFEKDGFRNYDDLSIGVIMQ